MIMNKKSMLLLAAMMGCFAAKATTVGDTLIIEDVKKVKIETGNTEQRIIINGAKDDPQFQYTQRISIPDTSAVRRTIKNVWDFNKIAIPGKDGKPSKWETSLHLNVGMSTLFDTPDGYDFKPSAEIGLSWLADYSPYGKKNVWSIGLGFNWRNYSYDNDYLLTKVNDVLVQIPYSSGLDKRSTSMNITSLNVPILYTHYFDNKQNWGITLGGIVNWNYYARTHSDYENGDELYSVKLNKIGVRPITVDAMAIVHLPFLFDIYCKYCPMELFKDNRGPKAHQFSIGICF